MTVLFRISNLLVLPFWALMILLPRWRWIFRDSRERRLSALLTAPVLFLTLMLGPLGFLIYLVIRAVAPSREAGKGSAQISAARVNGGEPSINGTQLGLRTEDPSKTLLQRAWRTNRPLTILGVAMILVFLATLAGILLDHRIITGAPAWLKPAKFAISVSVYCFTFVWLLGFVESSPRLARF